MKYLERTPSGAFMSRESAVTEWLPVMLSWIYREPLVVGLQAMQLYCVSQFWHQYERLLASRDWEEQENIDMKGIYQRNFHDRAQKWLRRRDILVRAIKDLRDMEVSQ